MQSTAIGGAPILCGVERMVRVDDHYQLWVENRGDPRATPLLLIMGANASGVAWPESLIAQLAGQHWILRYDHRDTGRSTWAFDSHPYAVRDLAEDVIRVLDAVGVDQAHVVGMSMGGTLVQLLLLDHPHRLRTATMFAICALGVRLADPTGQSSNELPGPDPGLLMMWQHLADERDRDAEIAWRIRPIGRDVGERRGALGTQFVEEAPQGLGGAVLAGPHQPAGVVIHDDQ
jgi:pimeloyl-ACP methyl ester carboxylesterase